MRLRNADGTPVDPVPFLVTAGLGFLLALSFGPLYGMAYGLSPPAAVGASAAVGTVAAAAAYQRLVRAARPADERVAVGLRFERVCYIGVGVGLLLLALSLPLVL